MDTLRRNSKRVAFGGLFVLLGFGLWLASGSYGLGTSVADDVRVEDTLPEQVETILAFEKVEAATTRLLGTTIEGARYWITESEGRGRVCLVAQMSSGVGGVSCVEADEFQHAGLRLEVTEGPAALGTETASKLHSAFLRPGDARFINVPSEAELVVPELLVQVSDFEIDMHELLESAVDSEEAGSVEFQVVPPSSALAEVGIDR